MKAKLHRRSVEAAGEGFTWDTELTGFGLKVTPQGKRVFLVQKRPQKGAKTLKRYTIGAYPSVSPEEARTQAKTILGRITLGLPTSAVLSQSGGQFVAEIEKYYVEHCLAKLKPTTIKDMRYMIDKHLIPTFGKMSLEDVTPMVVRSFHTALGSKHPYRANRVLALLSKFFSWKRLSPNPCRGIEKFREKRRELINSADRSFELLLQKRSELHPAIQLLLLTGMRKGEVLQLRWEHIDWSQSSIHLPDSKTGRKTIYLSPAALELLRGLRSADEGWVFPGKRGSTSHLVGLQKIWKKCLRQLNLPAHIRLHDLRHNYATLASECLTVPQLAGLLGHKDIKTTMRYVHNGDLTEASVSVGEQLAKLMERG